MPAWFFRKVGYKSVEAGHDHNHVGQQNPVLLDGASCFFAEGSHVSGTRFWLAVVEILGCLTGFGFTLGFHHQEMIRFGKVPSEDDWRTGLS
jgi:hypothetical protein